MKPPTEETEVFVQEYEWIVGLCDCGEFKCILWCHVCGVWRRKKVNVVIRSWHAAYFYRIAARQQLTSLCDKQSTMKWCGEKIEVRSDQVIFATAVLLIVVKILPFDCNLTACLILATLVRTFIPLQTAVRNTKGSLIPRTGHRVRWYKFDIGTIPINISFQSRIVASTCLCVALQCSRFLQLLLSFPRIQHSVLRRHKFFPVKMYL